MPAGESCPIDRPEETMAGLASLDPPVSRTYAGTSTGLHLVFSRAMLFLARLLPSSRVRHTPILYRNG